VCDITVHSSSCVPRPLKISTPPERLFAANDIGGNVAMCRIDFPVKNVSVYVQSLIFQLPDARGSEQESSD
jgi:hypothetical protein